MEAESIQSIPEEQRRRDTVAYSARDEQDYEELLEEMERVEDEDVAQAVEEINEVVDGELRNRVMNHFQAPIRSLNNPRQNRIELEDGTEVQIAGEEYASINGNLPGFGDVSDIKWWAAYDPGTYREETRADRSGEHLQFNREGELHGFRVEVDGEPVESQDVKRLARNLRIRRDNQVTTRNNIPQTVLDHENAEEAIESRNIDEEEFRSEYEEAKELGLVTENGNITLKGWLSTVDIEARDLRGLEDVANGGDTLELRSNNVPFIAGGNLENAEAQLSVEAEGGRLGEVSDMEYQGVIEIDSGKHEPIEGEEFIEAFESLNSLGFEVNDEGIIERARYNNDGSQSFDLTVSQYTELLRDIDTREAQEVLTHLENRFEDTSITSENLSVLEPEVEIELRDDEEYDFKEHIPYDLQEVEEELNQNLNLQFSKGQLKVEYDGGDTATSRLAEKLVDTGEFDVTNFFDSDGEANLSGGIFSTLIPSIRLLPYEEELQDHNTDLRHGISMFTSVEDYDSLSQDAINEINSLEEEGFIEREMYLEDDVEFEITASDPLEYREAVETLKSLDEEASDYLKFDQEEEEVTERFKAVRLSSNNEEGECFEDAFHDWIQRKEFGTAYALKDEMDSIKKQLDRMEEEGYKTHKFFSAMEAGSEDNIDRMEEQVERGNMDVEEVERTLEKTDYYSSIESGRIESHASVGDEELAELMDLRERGIIDFDNLSRKAYLDSDGGEKEAGKIWARSEMDASIDEEYLVSLDVTYENQSATYEVDERVERIANALDPMNFDSEPYEDVELETEFKNRSTEGQTIAAK